MASCRFPKEGGGARTAHMMSLELTGGQKGRGGGGCTIPASRLGCPESAGLTSPIRMMGAVHDVDV